MIDAPGWQNSYLLFQLLGDGGDVFALETGLGQFFGWEFQPGTNITFSVVR